VSCTSGEVRDIQIVTINLDDYYGQLGVGSERVVHNLPKVCSFNIVVKQVSCGEEHTVFVSGEGGYVYAMGSNADGKLGINNPKVKQCNVPTLVEGIYGVKQVSCGMSHTLAVTENGEAYSWGQAFYGALGLNSKNNVNASIEQ
jgi:X-linked retinitis pigmentosa GTPase regulator